MKIRIINQTTDTIKDGRFGEDYFYEIFSVLFPTKVDAIWNGLNTDGDYSTKNSRGDIIQFINMD